MALSLSMPAMAPLLEEAPTQLYSLKFSISSSSSSSELFAAAVLFSAGVMTPPPFFEVLNLSLRALTLKRPSGLSMFE